jgi:hypothetical protein
VGGSFELIELAEQGAVVVLGGFQGKITSRRPPLLRRRSTSAMTVLST